MGPVAFIGDLRFFFEPILCVVRCFVWQRERRGVAETDVASLRPKKKRSKVVDAEPIYLKLEDEVPNQLLLRLS